MKKSIPIFLFGLLVIIQHAFAQETLLFNWAKTLSSSSLYGRDITLDAAGNVYTISSFTGTVDFDPGPGVFNLTSAGNRDACVIKSDPNGNLIWAKSFGGTNVDDASAVAVDVSGNVYVHGFFQGTADFDPGPGIFNITATGVNLYVTKLDVNGNFIWAKAPPAGVAIWNYPDVMTLDASGNIYLVGMFGGTGDFDPGPGVFNLTANGNDAYMMKLDTNGNFVWAKSVGGPNNDPAYAVTVDPDGNVYVAGLFHTTVDFDPGPGVFNITSPNNNDLFILKLDANGNFIWAKAIIGTGSSSFEYATSLDTDASGNLLIAGYFQQTADFDPGPGVYNMTYVSGYVDVFIEKLDKDGNFVWVKSFGNNTNTVANALVTDASGNIYYAGKLGGPTDMDPGAGTYIIPSLANDAFVAKLDASGNFVWAVPTGSVNVDEAMSIAIDNSGNVFTTGLSGGIAGSPMDFDPSDCKYELPGLYFVQKFTIGSKPPTPTITSFTPTSGPVSTSVTITGTNFSSTIAENIVSFFNDKTATITSATSTELITNVPSGSTTGKISVFAKCVKTTSATDFTIVVGPTITSFSPASGAVNTNVTISGTNFSSTPANNTVRFNGTLATVLSSSSSTISTRVPAGATTGTISVTVAGVTGTSTNVFTVPGTISISPQPPANTSVCIGSSTTLTTGASGTTNITYQWQFSTTSTGTYTSISNGGGYSNVTTSSLTVNTAGNFGAGYYKCFISGDAAPSVLTNAARIIVNSMPNAPTASPDDACDHGSGGIAYLYATGGSSGNYRWYTTSSGGSPIPGQTTSPYLPNITSTTTFYVSVVSGACESPRTPVIATWFMAPPKPTITSNLPIVGNAITVCPGQLTLSGPDGYAWYLWYPVEDGGQDWTVRSSGSYTVRVNDGNCESYDSDPIDVTINTSGCINSTPVISLESVSTQVNGVVTLDLITKISDADNNIDLETLTITESPFSGAEAIITEEGILTIDYAGTRFAGTDRMRIGVCDYYGECDEKELTITVTGEIITYNGISPNGDGDNDFFRIENIESIDETKNNKVSIFNRWGDEVFSIENYDNDARVFRGVNKNGGELPSGVYFYKIEYPNGRKTETGYLSLKK